MIAFLMTWLYSIDFQISLSDDSFILICYFFEVLFLRKRAYALSVLRCAVGYGTQRVHVMRRPSSIWRENLNESTFNAGNSKALQSLLRY